MCYSAQLVADHLLYQRLGGLLDIEAFATLFHDLGEQGTFTSLVPRAVRDAFTQAHGDGEKIVRNAILDAYRSTAMVYEAIIVKESERLANAETKLAVKSTKTAINERRIATNKIEEAKAKIAGLCEHAVTDGWARIWPGHFAPVLVHDPSTGERKIIPMRYRARPIGWTKKDEKEKPGCYNARKSSLKTAWRGVFGVGHGIVLCRSFFESVWMHENQQRPLAPGEKEQNIEIVFTPVPEQEMFLAVIWRYVEPEDGEPGFYGFAAVTRDPPPEVLLAGHSRCVIALRSENVDAWLKPDPKHLDAMLDILENPIDAYYRNEMATQTDSPDNE